MKNVLIEKIEAYKSELGTSWGIVSFLISNLIEGFIIVTYIDEIFGFILSKTPFTGLLQEYIAYIIFGLTTTGIYLITLFILVGLFREIGFKNKRLL